MLAMLFRPTCSFLPTWWFIYIISPLNKMPAIFADDIFKWISMNEQLSIFIRISLMHVPKVQLTISQLGPGNGLAPIMRQAITWTNADPVHWRIYAALGRDELNGSSFAFGWHTGCQAIKQTIIDTQHHKITFNGNHFKTKYLHVRNMYAVSVFFLCPWRNELTHQRLHSISFHDSQGYPTRRHDFLNTVSHNKKTITWTLTKGQNVSSRALPNATKHVL